MYLKISLGGFSWFDQKNKKKKHDYILLQRQLSSISSIFVLNRRFADSCISFILVFESASCVSKVYQCQAFVFVFFFNDYHPISNVGKRKKRQNILLLFITRHNSKTLALPQKKEKEKKKASIPKITITFGSHKYVN